MSFAHLHVHTEYSLLDGLSNIKKLVATAKAMNMPAVAITDHGTMFGVKEFYDAAKAVDIKPIIGVEAYMAAGEVAGKIKKVFRDKDGEINGETKSALKAELGDVLWYLAQLATELDLTLEEIAEYNIDKLYGRLERGTIGGDGDER